MERRMRNREITRWRGAVRVAGSLLALCAGMGLDGPGGQVYAQTAPATASARGTTRARMRLDGWHEPREELVSIRTRCSPHDGLDERTQKEPQRRDFTIPPNRNSVRAPTSSFSGSISGCLTGH